MSARTMPWLLLAVLATGLAVAQDTGPAGAPTLDVSPPRVAVTSLETTVEVEAPTEGWPTEGASLELRDTGGTVLARADVAPGGRAALTFAPAGGAGWWGGTRGYAIAVPGHFIETLSVELRVIPGWLTVVPPLFAILLALVFRQVIPALLAGVWLGAWITYGNVLGAFLRTVDRYVVGALTDPDRISIVVFSLMLGGMVGVMSRSGGTAGLVEAIRPYATDSRRGQIATWALGLAVFFDDYANTLVVGNTMRPVSDRLRISREKLAYIVDSTAAPVAAILLISTWIGYEVSLIGESLEAVGSETDAYVVFLQAIPYNFYPILALVFGFMVAWSGRDFGPMHAAEVRAEAGRVMREGAVPLSDFDNAALAPVEGKPRRWLNAAFPVFVVITVTFLALWISGRSSLVADGDPQGTAGVFELGLAGLGNVLGAGNSYHALLYAAFSGCFVAIAMAVSQRILALSGALEAMLGGFKSMVMAFVILTLAWSISQVCSDLSTSAFMVSTLSDTLDPRILPALVFLISAVTAFATGSSWGTMGILIPLAVPTAYGVAQSAGYAADVSHGILLGAVASVLAGSIFGDHCSPISDTTVLSSMSSGCDHLDHVRTQLPYALVVGGVATVVGSIPSGFGLSPWIGLALSTVVLGLLLRVAGRTRKQAV